MFVNSVLVIMNWFSLSECDRNLTTMSGMILSPNHPGYYPPLTRCQWIINVPRGNTIKLRFLEFQLEDHPSCFNDFLDIYSGLKSRKVMGRYCGERFPAFLVSSSNAVTITFVSNDKVSGSGFKLHYTSEEGEQLNLDGLSVIHHQTLGWGLILTGSFQCSLLRMGGSLLYGLQVTLEKTCAVLDITHWKKIFQKEEMDSVQRGKHLMTFPNVIYNVNYIQDGRNLITVILDDVMFLRNCIVR